MIVEQIFATKKAAEPRERSQWIFRSAEQVSKANWSRRDIPAASLFRKRIPAFFKVFAGVGDELSAKMCWQAQFKRLNEDSKEVHTLCFP